MNIRFLKKKSVYIPIIIVIFISVPILSLYLRHLWKINEMQNNISLYLKNKYGMEFVVKRPRINNTYWFSYSFYDSIAYPKNLPAVKFIVSGNINKDNSYEDDYLDSNRSYQGKLEINKKLNEIYNQYVILQYSLKTRREDLQRLSHSDIITKYGQETIFDLFYCVFLDKEFDKKNEAQKAYKIFKEYISDNKVGVYNFFVWYLKKGSKNQIIKEINNPSTDNPWIDYEKLHDKKILFNVININSNDKVQNYNDFLKRFIY